MPYQRQALVRSSSALAPRGLESMACRVQGTCWSEVFDTGFPREDATRSRKAH